ncbi:DHS-like NAD/FAD-binding domain-containing protein [Protomyces lactucae-debilis]|uniref:DHS-like NAD/FAD-binding domain-containing protein n=1 Tax=Protomyces lactucae-debilis TaxID=2754530 RepID=A0A1Y2EWX7_PROLT|nr:DHS-like NAD/FAD-binding domain-containing protein [Protomyces lactucae-debilis]ORY76089.1 DHS-like NAD/FAD-binding domain-containing protein [Protomyces lactucae-debilis]
MTIKLQFDERLHKQQLIAVVDQVVAAKRVLFVSGAGISCSAGIPDFRSLHGLYQTRHTRGGNGPTSQTRGKDLFDISLFNSDETTSQFYKFMAELRQSTQRAKPTLTHKFLETLKHNGTLLRAYTQNIDGLEGRTGVLSMHDAPINKNDVIQLHGNVHILKCFLCGRRAEYTPEYEQLLRGGEAPSCAHCLEKASIRSSLGKRAISVGTLRPDVVLYGEAHPHGEAIAKACASDARRKPDCLIIAGTSLKIAGLKRLIKDFAKEVHAAGGNVIFVNLTQPNASEWQGVIDTYIEGATDDFVQLLKQQRPAFFKHQSTLDKVPKVKHGKRMGCATKHAKKKSAAASASQPHATLPVVQDYPTPPASEQTPTELDFNRLSQREDSAMPCIMERSYSSDSRRSTLSSLSTAPSLDEEEIQAQEAAYAARQLSRTAVPWLMHARPTASYLTRSVPILQCSTPPPSQEEAFQCPSSIASRFNASSQGQCEESDKENEEPFLLEQFSQSTCANGQLPTPSKKRSSAEMRIEYLINSPLAKKQMPCRSPPMAAPPSFESAIEACKNIASASPAVYIAPIVPPLVVLPAVMEPDMPLTRRSQRIGRKA